MKLKIGDIVYLQKYDVAYLLHHLGSFEPGLLEETFRDENGELGAFWMNGGPDGLTFDNAFRDPKNVEWLMNQDYILDFEKFKDMTVEEIKALHDDDVKRTQEMIDDYNSMPKAYKEEHFDEIGDIIKKLNGKSVSYHFMIAYLSGERKFTFPKGYNPRKSTEPVNKEIVERSGLFGFFRRLFGHRNSVQ